MYKINLYSVGKNKEKWLEAAIKLYCERLKNVLKIHFIWCKDNNQLLKAVEKEKFLICLDPKGKEVTSEQFSKILFDELEVSGCLLGLVIGDFMGLPKELKSKKLISLSKLVFTHQICRLVLIEQIYRAFEIKKGSPYHFS